MSKAVPVRSDRCGLDELFLSYEPGDAERARLALGPGWTRQWTATWQVPGGDEVSLVRDLGPVPVAGRRLARPSLHADRRRQRQVHPADSSTPARPDDRRRLPQRC